MVGFENPMKEKGIKKEVKKGNTTKNNRNKFPKHLIVTGEEEKSEKNEMKELKEKKERKEHNETKPFETIHTDATTGRRYSHNRDTGATEWITNAEENKNERTETPETIHTDATTGRRYSHNRDTGATKWLTDEAGKVTQKTHRKKKSFRKIDTTEHGLYFINVETGEPVWKMPVDGEIVV